MAADMPTPEANKVERPLCINQRRGACAVSREGRFRRGPKGPIIDAEPPRRWPVLFLPQPPLPCFVPKVAGLDFYWPFQAGDRVREKTLADINNFGSIPPTNHQPWPPTRCARKWGRSRQDYRPKGEKPTVHFSQSDHFIAGMKKVGQYDRPNLNGRTPLWQWTGSSVKSTEAKGMIRKARNAVPRSNTL